jgi:hypothetical protein
MVSDKKFNAAQAQTLKRAVTRWENEGVPRMIEILTRLVPPSSAKSAMPKPSTFALALSN